MNKTKTNLENRWAKLLDPKRLCRNEPAGYSSSDRGEFDRDYDRIVFSSAFRRLKDKTQVFPLSKNDFTRTRLTHSLEVACVGRSLGRRLETLLKDKKHYPDFEPDIKTIVSAACLAHDIGNPPFGHSGEASIQRWAKQNVSANSNARYLVEDIQQVQDLHEFEGNAQAIRVLCRIQARRKNGGLQLTYPTLGAVMKYPCGSLIDKKHRPKSFIGQKKFGYFQDDEKLIFEALRAMELDEYQAGAFKRHPLTYLVEAADDICYGVVDLEDSVDQGLVSLKEAYEVMRPIGAMAANDAGNTKHFNKKCNQYEGESRIRWLRAYVIQGLVNSCFRVVEENYEIFATDHLKKDLMSHSKRAAPLYKKLKEVVKRTAYLNDRVLQVEIAGFNVIGGLLDIFVPALVSCDRSPIEKKVVDLFPLAYLQQPADRTTKEEALAKLTTYQRILAVTDYISGMTDNFAVNCYQKLSGIALPE